MLTHVLKIRLFGLYIRHEQHGDVEGLTVLLAASKFLDLVLVLGIEEFQWYQWIFVSELEESGIVISGLSRTTKSTALADKLHLELSESSEIELVRLSTITLRFKSDFNFFLCQPPAIDALAPRRPLITMRSITNIHQLESFFHSISSYVRQSFLELVGPDIVYIEKSLEADFLDA